MRVRYRGGFGNAAARQDYMHSYDGKAGSLDHR